MHKMIVSVVQESPVGGAVGPRRPACTFYLIGEAPARRRF